MLRIQGRPLTLVLGGEPIERHQEWLQEWRDAGIAEAIVTPGFIAEDELASWYHGAVLTVVPSFHEGFGLLAVEFLVVPSTEDPQIFEGVGALGPSRLSVINFKISLGTTNLAGFWI